MDDFEPVNFDFLINSDEIKKESANVKAELNGVIYTAEEMAEVVAKAFKTPVSSEAAAAIGRVTVQYQQGAITLQKYREELDKINNVQSQPVKVSTAPAVDNVGAIPRLQAQIEALNKTKLTLDADELPVINAKLEGLNNELSRLNKIGTEAFEKLDDEASKPVGQIERLSAAMRLYREASETSFNSDIIAKYNGKLEEAAARMEKLQRAGRSGYDNAGNAQAAPVDDNALQTGLTGFSALTPAAQEAYISIAKLKDEITVTRAQANGLNAAFKSGLLSIEDYDRASIGLSVHENELREKIQLANFALQNQPGNLKNTKDGYDGLGNSITQITREIPAFAFSVQTGFQAISNNIGPLADEISKLQLANTRSTQAAQADARAKGDQAKAAELAGGATEEAASAVGDLVTQQALSAIEGGKGVSIFKQLASSIFSWNTLLSVGVTLLTVYGKEIFSFVKDLISGAESIDQMKVNLESLNGVMANANKEAGKQAATLDILYSAATDLTNADEDRLAAAKELQKQFPKEFANATAISIINGTLKGTYDDLTASILENAKAKAAAQRINEITAKNLDLEYKRRKTQNVIENQQNRVKKDIVNAPGSYSYNANYNNQTIEQQKAAIAAEHANDLLKIDNDKKANDAEIEFLTKAAGGKKKIAESLVTDTTIADNKKSDADAKRIAAQAKRDEAAAAEELKRRQNLYKQIGELENEYARKGLTDDQADLTAISDKFDKMRKEIDIFNADPKNKVKIAASVETDLDNLQTAALTEQANKAETEYIKTDIDKKKALYADYLSYRDRLGKEAADKEYAELLKSGADINEYLGNIAKSIPESDQSGAKQELKKAVTDAQAAETVTQSAHLAELLTSFQDFNGKMIAAQDRYNTEREKLVARGAFGAVDELDRQYALEREALEAGQSAKIASVQRYNDNVIELTRKQAKAQIDTLLELQQGSDLTPAQNTDIDAQVNKLKAAIGNIGGLSRAYSADLERQKSQLLEQIKPLSVGSAKWTEIKNKIAEVNELLKKQDGSALKKSFADIADYAGAASSGFSTLANSLTNINPGLSDTLSTLSEISKTVSDAANLGGAIMSGNIAGIITGVASVASDVIGLFTRGRKSAAEAVVELAKRQDDLFKGELAYNQLLRERARSQQDINNLTWLLHKAYIFPNIDLLDQFVWLLGKLVSVV